MAFTIIAAHKVMAGEPSPSQETKIIACDDAGIALAPYVWKRTGSGEAARAEAAMPGAYLKLEFRGSSALGLRVDGTGNNNCPPSCMPVVDYSVDNGSFKSTQLTRTGEVYVLPLAQALEPDKQHHAEVYFRSGCLDADRWSVSTRHLRIAGIQLDKGGTLAPVQLRTKKAIGFGDSITEGVNVEGSVPYYSNLLMNNARSTWFPIVCAALDCEYGQLGTGGQGMITTTLQIPPLPQTWDHYDAATSRLTNGLLDPEPDYVFCLMGTNDSTYKDKHLTIMDIGAAYSGWLVAVRKSCPTARIFCIIPPLGWHASEMQTAVNGRHAAGDQKVYLIDTAPLKAGFGLDIGPTALAVDGVHPSEYGDAMLGALIAVEAQKVLGGGR
jgi:lysophospholipase L1-like esterase